MGTRKLRTRIIRGLGGAVAVAAIAGAGTALAVSQSVTIADLSFSPPAVTVSVGDTVTWTNTDNEIHTATADDGSWNAGNIAANGGIGAVVFTTAGTFPYHCTIHPQMTGSVTVAAAGATAAPAATMHPTDTAPIAGTGGGSGAGLLPSLLIVGLAAAVAILVLLRPSTPSVVTTVPVPATAGGRVASPLIETAPAANEESPHDRSLAPVVVVAIAGAVAVAVVWRRFTAGR